MQRDGLGGPLYFTGTRDIGENADSGIRPMLRIYLLDCVQERRLGARQPRSSRRHEPIRAPRRDRWMPLLPPVTKATCPLRDVAAVFWSQAGFSAVILRHADCYRWML